MIAYTNTTCTIFLRC